MDQLDISRYSNNAELNGGSRSVERLVGPVCSNCGEAPHQLKNCPACQNAEVTRMHLLNCRKLLREAMDSMDRRFGNSIYYRTLDELKWPNDQEHLTQP